MFLIAEVLILFFALVIAGCRQLRNPVLFPFRMLAVVYTMSSGSAAHYRGSTASGSAPRPLHTRSLHAVGLRVRHRRTRAVVLGYVAEVYRAGINSVHQSQVGSSSIARVCRSGSPCVSWCSRRLFAP